MPLERNIFYEILSREKETETYTEKEKTREKPLPTAILSFSTLSK